MLRARCRARAACPFEYLQCLKFDDLVKSRNIINFVIPAKAGIQLFHDVLDPGFRRGDGVFDFLRTHQIWMVHILIIF